MNRLVLLCVIALGALFSMHRVTGVFVVPPKDSVPQGCMYIYWRVGEETPYLTSSKGLVNQSNACNSKMMYEFIDSATTEMVLEKEIVQLPYIPFVYKRSL